MLMLVLVLVLALALALVLVLVDPSDESLTTGHSKIYCGGGDDDW